MLGDKARLQKMSQKLYELVEEGYVTDDWEIEFICDVRIKLNDRRYQSLTPTQVSKLEELFERY